MKNGTFFFSYLLLFTFFGAGAHAKPLKVGVISTGPRFLPQKGCGWSPRPKEFHEQEPSGGNAPLYDVLGMESELKARGVKYKLDIRQGKPAELPGLAKEMVASGVDFIVGIGTTGVEAPQSATKTIPILFPNVSDPVLDRFAQSWWKPGGNITGFSARLAQESGRRLELLKLMVGAKLKKVMTLYREDFAPGVRAAELMRAEAKRLEIELIEVTVKTRSDIESALEKIPAQGVDGIIMVPEAFVAANNDLVLNASSKFKVPYMGVHDYLADWGAIGSLGTFPHGAGREVASYILRIKAGEKPGDLPVLTLPIYFVINLKAAKCMGITVPPEVIKLADRVIAE